MVQLRGEGVVKGHLAAHVVFHVRDGTVEGVSQALKVKYGVPGFNIEKTGKFGRMTAGGHALADFGQGQSVFVDQDVVDRFLFEILP